MSKIYLIIVIFFVAFGTASEDIKIKDVTINRANFNLNKKTYTFFTNLLDNKFTDGVFKIKNSNILFIFPHLIYE